MTLVIPAASFLLGMISMGVIWVYDGRQVTRQRTRQSASVAKVLENLTEKQKWELFYGDPKSRLFSKTPKRR